MKKDRYYCETLLAFLYLVFFLASTCFKFEEKAPFFP